MSERHYSRFFGAFFILGSLLPFFGVPEFDSQPFPILFAIAFILSLLVNRKLILPPNVLNWFLIFIVFGCLFSIVKDATVSILSVRAVAGYLGIYIYYLAFENYLRHYGFPTKLFPVLVLIWVAVGLIQLFYPDIVSNFVAQRTTIDRGVTSLAPEPTYFAIFLFFSSWLMLMSRHYYPNLKTSFVCMIGLFSALLLAKSSMILLFFIISAGMATLYFFFSQKYMLILKIFLAVMVTSFFIIVFLPEESRLMTFIDALSKTGFTFFMEDESSNQRLSDIVLPFFGLLNNQLLPAGFMSYFEKSKEISSGLVMFFPFANSAKIMSWAMSMWYELGIFGILGWFSLFASCVRDSNMRGIFESILLFLLLLSAIPILFPLPVMVMVMIRLNCSRCVITKKAQLHKQ